MIKIKHLIFFFFLVPSITLGAFSLENLNFKGLIKEVLIIINLLVPILFGIALVVFFWGLSKFILNANKPEEIENGKNYMIWGVFVLFILFTFTTIIGLVSNELEIGSKDPVVPKLNESAQ
jgi:hypothetical protein